MTYAQILTGSCWMMCYHKSLDFSHSTSNIIFIKINNFMDKFNKNSIITALAVSFVIITAVVVWWSGGLGNIMSKSQFAAVATANLSSTANFAVLAGGAVADATLSHITGDVGLSPASGSFIAVTCGEVTGQIYSTDAAGPLCKVTNASLLTQAKNDLTTAYNDVANRTPATTLAGSDNQLGGKTLTSGVYTFSAASTANLIGTLTLDGQGNPNSVFMFQTSSTLVTQSASAVLLVNGAQACNVFWQVGSSATLGTGTSFVGTIMADQSITDAGGSTINGRLLASVATVTLNNTTVTAPTCATPSGGGVGFKYPTEGTINVVKTVVNDNGGTKTVADFPLFVSNHAVISGETNSFHAPVYPYFITETNDPTYTRTFSGDCDADGRINLNPSENKFCIVTNDDIGPALATPPVPPLIEVVKVASPLSLPAGPGPVVYTYTLHNIGTVPVADITMVGDSCRPVTLVSGDSNNDSKLDMDETWKYLCSTTLQQTHTNTIVATGWANGISTTDIASAMVVVGAPIVPPLIHVVKKPDVFTLPASGGEVTYTYTVTNPGTAPLSNVSITDNKCTGLPGRVIGHPGDLNKNNLLESNETWLFTCKSNLRQTTTNIGIASGSANGLTARDFSIATVVVSVPGLPNTGFAPGNKNVPLAIAVLSGFFGVSILFFSRRKKLI